MQPIVLPIGMWKESMALSSMPSLFHPEEGLLAILSAVEAGTR